MKRHRTGYQRTLSRHTARNARGLLLCALDAEPFRVEAAVAVRPSAQPTFLDQNDVILLTRDAACYASEISGHMGTSFPRRRSRMGHPYGSEAAGLAP
jgi:hypothetical protein